MTLEIIIEVILFGFALSMDAFMVSITEGLTFKDLNKKKSVFIAFTYGFFQALFPIIGYFLIHLARIVVGNEASSKFGHILDTTVSWLSFALLLFLGIKMIIEALKEAKLETEEKSDKFFSVKEVLIMGVATAIDALATGVAFNNTNASGETFSTPSTIWLHASIIMVITFFMCLIGIILARQISKLLKGRFEITGIIGGSILILLGIWILLSHYFNI